MISRVILLGFVAVSASAYAAEPTDYRATCQALVHSLEDTEVQKIPSDMCAEFVNKKISTKPSEEFRHKFPPSVYMWKFTFSSFSGVWVRPEGENVSAQLTLLSINEERDALGGPFMSLALNKTNQKWNEHNVVLNSFLALDDGVRLIMEACKRQPACNISNAKLRQGTRTIRKNAYAE